MILTLFGRVKMTFIIILYNRVNFFLILYLLKIYYKKQLSLK
jgi:hypothetical protein